LLHVENLGVERRDSSPLWDVSFEIPPGGIAGIVGPQGSGKTTLLRVLAGLEHATHGFAALSDVELTANPVAARAYTGYVSEHHGFYREMAAGEYLEFIAACHGGSGSERDAIVQDLLSVVDLLDYRHVRIDRLSRGMCQRLSIARSLVHDPPLLLLDDPFLGLDTRSRLEVADLLHELKEMGKMLLICTAEMGALADLATHVGIMNGGRLVTFGPKEEIIARGHRTRMIEVRVNGTPERVAELLRAIPLVRAVAAEGNLLKISYLGGDGAVQSVLSALVRSGTTVSSFHEARGGLEEVLREITEG